MNESLKFLEILKKDDPNDLAELLLLQLIDYSKAQSGCVYFLDLLNSNFTKRFAYAGDDMPESIDFETIKSDLILTKTIIKIEPHNSNENLIVPIYRSANNKKYCLGFLNLQKQQNIGDQKIAFIEDIIVIFNQVFRNLFLNNLLQTGNHPISFKKSSDEYYKDILSLISTATRLPLIALREYDENSGALNCISSYGFDFNPPDFPKDNTPSVFNEVIVNRKSLQTAFGNNFDNFPELKGLGIIRIILLPILVGDSVWGVMSLATKCDYFFSGSEILGLETVAHGIGVSINNYHNYNNANVSLIDLTNSATLVTGIEIAQAVRHEAKNLLNESQLSLLLIEKINDKIKRGELVTSLSTKLVEVYNSLEKIRTATKPPEKVLSNVNLKVIWDEAIQMLQGRLAEHDIEVKTVGSLNINFRAYKDWLRQAFLNLLLNSIDAFKDRSKKNREITLSIDSSTESKDKISLAYMDNAGGIEVQNLVTPEFISENIKSDLNQLIFQPNVTSKELGSGYGLYLTRLTI